MNLGIFICSNLLGSIFQIAALPVVILAPLGAVSLLWNAFFARLLLGDVFSPWMFIGTLLIAGGAVLIAIFGIVPEPTHSLEDLLRLFSRPAFIIYFSLLGLAVVVCLAVVSSPKHSKRWMLVTLIHGQTHITEYSMNRRIRLPDVSPPLSPLLAPTSAPSILTTASATSHVIDPSSATERTPLIDRKPRSKSPAPSSVSTQYDFRNWSPSAARLPIILATSYASFSGIIAGMCLIFAKSGVELLMLTISGDNQFWRWQTWVLLLVLVICALLQLWYMHKGLILADPTLVCPRTFLSFCCTPALSTYRNPTVAFCFYNLSSIVNGLVYFDQFSLLSTKNLLLVLLGIVILLSGVWAVSFPPTGGYGVDVGTWTEGEALMDLELSDEGDADAHIITTPVAPAQVGEASTHPETSVSPKPSASASQRHAYTLPASRHVTASQFTDSTSHTTHSPPSPTHRRSAVMTSPRRSRASLMLSPQGGESVLSPMLPPGGSAIAGFSIGLSPVSPGFSLVPRERRRRSVAYGNVRSESGNEPGSAGLAASFSAESEDWRGIAAPPIRRVVSDGDVSSDRLQDVEGGQVAEEHEAGPSSASENSWVKKRWRWLRKLLPVKELADET